MALLYDFLDFIIKIISLTISRKSYKNIEAFDLPMSIELSFLAKNVGGRLKTLTVSREKLAKIVKCIIEVCHMYSSEEMFFEDKVVSIFNASKGFVSYEHSIIKHNLCQLAYQLICLCPSMLYTLADLE